eukprot:TRINITY_DN48662_c0_g1_i2.p2 TRINITY_DN48662_c0_g1~~TRINITY_DN48662_c0_g1_i2.p2  ORF type:complete len:161 (+),score=20.79 TRINITY_DN48662_c0_g1_i2:102-584(+)
MSNGVYKEYRRHVYQSCSLVDDTPMVSEAMSTVNLGDCDWQTQHRYVWQTISLNFVQTVMRAQTPQFVYVFLKKEAADSGAEKNLLDETIFFQDELKAIYEAQYPNLVNVIVGSKNAYALAVEMSQKYPGLKQRHIQCMDGTGGFEDCVNYWTTQISNGA